MSGEPADSRWLVAALPGAVVCVRGTIEIRLAIAAGPETLAAVAAAIAAGPDAGSLAASAGCSFAEAHEVLERLRDGGVLGPGPGVAPRTGVPLAAALGSHVPADAVWTADEALLLPEGVSAAVRAAAVAAFARGLEPPARADAYAWAATGTGAVHGDHPDGPDADARIAAARRADPDGLLVVPLDRDAEPCRLAPGALGRLAMDGPHRLGPLLAEGGGAAEGPARGLTLAWARFAATPRRPWWPAGQRIAHGAAVDPEAAAVIARAEAAERRAGADGAGLRLVRAPAAALKGAVPVGELVRWSERQAAAHGWRIPGPAEPLLWAPAATLGGAPQWVPAVRALSIADPEGPPLPGVTSSGVAAHPRRADAIEHAACELIERDAFLWTWVQRLSRERFALASAPTPVRDRAAACVRAGWTVDLVNLTLDTVPVVLAALRGPEGVALGAAARPSAAAAAGRALQEAAVLADGLSRRPRRDLRAEDVAEVEDHLDLWRRPGAAEQAEFLWSAPDEIDLREVGDAAGPAADLAGIAGEPLAVDLTGPATAPFAVVRLLVPGLVPMTFGWDGEPLGMARLGAPIDTVDGHRLGRRLDLEALGPLLPHPFA